SEQVDILHQTSAIGTPITLDTGGHPSISGQPSSSSAFRLPQPYRYAIKNFKDGISTIKGLTLMTTDGSSPLKVIVGITKEENDRLLQIISDNALNNPRLFLTGYDPVVNSNTPDEDIPYKKYRLAIT